MQTFLPEVSFSKSAEVLDRQRLGKQRVECKQILLALEDPNYGWQNHPAVKMWKGCEGVLAVYGSVICAEWILRGYKDSLYPFFKERIKNSKFPDWLGDFKFHESHRSNLLRKDYAHYSKFWPYTRSDMPYFWPVS